MEKLQNTISPYYTKNVNNSDTIFYSLSRLALISDESSNLEKVDKVLQLILIIWLNNSCFKNCVEKNAFSQLCQILNNISQIDMPEDS